MVNQKNILLGITLIISIGVGGYYLYKNYNNTKKEEDTD